MTRDYRVNMRKATQLIIAGIAATTLMLAIAYLLRAAGVVAPDFAAQYGAILNKRFYPTRYSDIWWAGMGWHVLNGVFIFPFVFDYLVDRLILTSRRWVKGLLYGLGIWMLVSIIVAPLAGEGLVFRNTISPFSMTLTCLIAWLSYGLALEAMTRVRVVHEMRLDYRRSA